MAEVVNLQQVLEALAASGAETDTLLTAVGELASVPAGGFTTPVNTLYTLESANGTPLANVINIAQQAASEAAQAGNSNIAGAAGTFTSSQGASAAAGQTAGMSSFFGGAKKFLNQTLIGTEHFGIGTVAAPIAAVAVGAKAGKTLDSLIYSTGKFFGLDMAETLNPQTWDSITYDMADTGLEGVYKRGIQMLLGLNQNSGELEAYMPQDAFNYLSYVLAKAGYFEAGNAYNYDVPTGSSAVWYLPKPCSVLGVSMVEYGNPQASDTAVIAFEYYSNNPAVKFVNVKDNNNHFVRYTIGPKGATFITKEYKKNGTTSEYGSTIPSSGNISSITLPDGSTYTPSTNLQIVTGTYSAARQPSGDFNIISGGYGSTQLAAQVAYVYENGTPSASIPGTGNQQGATVPNIGSNSTEQEVADAMNNTFPELVGDRVEMPVAVPGTIPKPVTYVQVPLPASVTSTSQGTEPIIKPTETPQANPGINPQTATDPLAALVLKILTAQQAVNMPDPATDPEHYPNGVPEEPVNTNPADVGTGTTPPLVVPVGSASALWTVYNPTMSEINALGAWLWSSNFIDQLLKMFSDPMQAIIGVHKVFASPAVSGRSNIVVGYLDSGVAANVVGSQYTTINCGTIKLSEYFGNVFDYSPHTKVSLFLPFIGVVDLDVGEVMRASMSVIYHVDVFSGACLAEVNVTRDGTAGGVLYTFSGDAAVRYPLSSGSYMGMVSGVLSVIGGIAGTIASGGSLAPALLGGAAGIGNAHTSVQHSGSISGNAGAMGGKKPYLIIRRPQTALANNFEHYSGVGANQRVTVFQMDGYFRLEDIRNVNIKGATDTEIEEIIRALEEGVLM